jgi:hypothetical protein
MNEDLMSMGEILSAVSLLKYMYDNGNAEVVSQMSEETFMYDTLPTLYYGAMNYAAEYVIESDSEDYGANKWYFADPDMTGYYRMAKKLGRLRGISKRNNPYYAKARRFIFDRLGGGYYAFSLVLHTGTKRRYSSAVILYVSYDFNDPFDLAEFMHQIFVFYRRELAAMRAEYAALTTPARLEAA